MTRSVFRAAVAGLGLFALVMQYWLGAANRGDTTLATWTIRYFSFFTIVTNTLAMLAMGLPVVAARSAAGRFFERAGVRMAIAGYILIVFAVYFVVLRHSWSPQGWQLIVDRILHYAIPALFIADWLVFVPRVGLPWRDVLAALLLPLAYIVWTLLHGVATGWYPYPFLDVSRLGYPAVLANIGGLFLVFLAVGLVLAAIDRWFAAGPTRSR
jgi:hypothetical protein